MWGYDPLYAFTRGWALLLPFLVGCVVTSSGHAAVSRRLPLAAGAALIGTAVWLWVGLATGAATPTTGGDGRTVSTVARGVLGCVAGTLATLAVAALMARTPLGVPLALIGRRSLEIFLAHIVVASGTRILLVQVGVTDPWVHVLAGTSSGVVVPVVDRGGGGAAGVVVGVRPATAHGAWSAQRPSIVDRLMSSSPSSRSACSRVRGTPG